MRKIFFASILLGLILSSCIKYSDRYRPLLYVHNQSNTNIYVLFTDKENLQATPKLELYLKAHYIQQSQSRNCTDTVIYPDNRIESHSYTYFYDDGFHTNSKFRPFPNINYVNFFFIKESTLRNNTWQKIVEKQMYEKKVKYTYDQLEEMDYKITYSP